MPGRHGYAALGGWGTSSTSGGSLPADLIVNSRAGNLPTEYVASNSIELLPGFESGTTDEFTAYIDATGGSGSGGSTGEGSGLYRYGFNGKENDDEIKGTGNLQDYGMRVYDPRIGKFLSVDPLTKNYTELTPYQFASNSPIAGIDLDGLEFYYAADGTYLGAGKNGGTQLRIATKYETTNTGNSIIHSYKEFKTNSDFSRLGRNEAGKSLIGDAKNRDFTGVRTLSKNEIGRVLAFGIQVFKNAPALASDYGAVYKESVGRGNNQNYGLLDFKFVAYDLLNIDRNNLLEIEGIVYSPGEAGNFLWGMVLAYQDVAGAPEIAELGTKGRRDEPYDQKAIKAGDKFGEKLDEVGSKDPAKTSADKYLKSKQSKKDVERISKDNGREE